MIARGLFLLVLLAAMSVRTLGWAQDMPQLTVAMQEGDIIVGQPATLRLKLLVPSWMPKPPVWPTLEVPSLLVRLPERASTAVSEKINGETWSGISRLYRLYPLNLGPYEIPGQKIIVTYADPGKPDPVVAELTLEPIRFASVLPKGAEGLDPPIVASGLTLQQTIEGGPELATGDAVTRVVTVAIEGTTPIILPSLMPEPLPDSTLPDPLRAYPREPVVSETEQRGVLSGQRVEVTTYVAQAEGIVQLAPITLDWFNLDSGKVETIKLGGLSLSVTAPPPPPPGPADYARWGAIGIGMLALAWGLVRLIGPGLHRVLRKGRTAWLCSEPFGARQVTRALRSGDLNETYRALDRWAALMPHSDQPEQQALGRALDRALATLGAARYSAADPSDAAGDRARVGQAFAALRRTARKRATRGGLLPLNP